jgi:GTPase KRas protein
MDIPTINVVIAGDVGTGKSALTINLIKSMFVPGFDPTVEDTYFRQVDLDGKKYNLKITDTVDNEFRNEEQKISMYQDCDVIFLTYATNDADSFNNLYIRYHNLPIHEEDGSTKLTYKNGEIHYFPPIILLGCKADLENQRQVAQHSAGRLTKDLKLQDFIECSSASNLNVEEVLRKAISFGLAHSQTEHDVTHIYAADEESQMRHSDRRNSSIDSAQSVSTNANSTSPNNSSNSCRNTRINSNIGRIEEDDNEAVAEVNRPQRLQSRSGKPESVKITVTKTVSKRSPRPRREERPSTGSTGCCTIM